MFDKLIYAAYAFFLFSGGYMGLVKGGSKTSLIMGTVMGGLMLVAVVLVGTHLRKSVMLASGVSGMLSIVFLVRLMKTQTFMPAGMLMLLSVIICVYSLVRLTQTK